MPVALDPTDLLPDDDSLSVGESVILDPSEEAIGRTEIDITPWVGDAGPDWGDAAIEQFLAEAERGSQPVDHRFPNRQITIPLIVLEWAGVSFEEMRKRIQAKAALFQLEGGWIKRRTSVGPVYANIIGATLKMGGSRLQGWRGVDVDAVLTLEALPDFYGDEEELELHSETSEAELIFNEIELKGNYPGRVRLLVTDDEGQDQKGLLWGVRSRHYSREDSAQLAYKAETLTRLDTADLTTLAGSAGTYVVTHDNLSSDWTPVLSTQATGDGRHMTHTGTYRMFARVRSSSPSPGVQVSLRALWDVGDLALPQENDPWILPGANQYYIVDLGEVRLDVPPTGTHRWLGHIQAKGTNGGEDVSIDKVWFQPVDEGAGRLSAPFTPSLGGFTSYSARDEFNQALGSLAGKTPAVGGDWQGTGDGTGFDIVAGARVQRTAFTDAEDTGRWATITSPVLTDAAVRVDFDGFPLNTSDRLRMMVVARYVDDNNWIAAGLEDTTADNGVTRWQVIKRVAGVVTSLYDGPDLHLYSMEGKSAFLEVDAFTGAWTFHTATSAHNLLHEASGSDDDLATGGVLASGLVGMYDEMWGGVDLYARYYDNFAAWVPTRDAVVFGSQSVELRTEGMFREDSTGVSSGPVSRVVGDLIRFPPAGLEGRTLEVFLKMSRGDLDMIPDSAIDNLSAQAFYRPSYLFVSNQ